MSKKYTFNDWLAGSLPDDKVTQEFLTGNMDADERKRIADAKKQAFHWGVETRVKALINEMLDQKTSKDFKRWIEIEINKVNSHINDHPEIEKLFIQDKADTNLITASKYKLAKSQYERFKKGERITFGTEEIINGKHKPNRLERMYIYKEYLEHLTDQFNRQKRNNPKPNKTAKDMLETEQRNRPKKEAVISEAVRLIQKTDKDYTTPSNNCQKWLWDHPKIQKIDSGNARGWLDNAIKDGTINRKLKELPME